MSPDFPARGIEIADALTARHGPLTLQPDDVKEILLFTVANMMIFASLARQLQLSSERFHDLSQPSRSVLHLMGLSHEEAISFVKATAEDLVDLSSAQ